MMKLLLRRCKIYFSQFDSFRNTTNDCKSFTIAVDRTVGEPITSSPIPLEALESVLEDLVAVEGGSPLYLWKGPSHELIIVPSQLISAVRLMFR